MYRAKAAGKSNYVLYDESMHDHAIDRLELETSLRKALDNGEIYVEYQPLIDLTTNQMIGAEALGRWRHPDRGVISPEVFIPIAEDTGLIVSIGYWILEQSCIQAKKWGIGRDIQSFVISVNLSGKQLQRDDVVERIRQVLERTGLPASQLKLEITETVLMEDREDIIEKMFQLKDLGLQLALDDFGTGYSSLSTLRTFPIDTLKIDRAFICRLGMEASALPIVEAILGLARTMQMTVIGEGVENQTQQDIIRALGCQVGQGYFYDKPLSPSELGKRLRQIIEPDQMAA
jgi:EAL domain-containing protein (putative c-di-GMP-specific phosphodiesterase class I)